MAIKNFFKKVGRGIGKFAGKVLNGVKKGAEIVGKVAKPVLNVLSALPGKVGLIGKIGSISTDIPKNIWLTRYYNKDGTSIAVKGIAQSIVDIYEYYKNLRVVSPQSNIRLNELKVVTQNMQSEDSKYLAGLAIDRDTDRLYSFEISNTNLPVQRTDNDSSQEENKGDDESIIIPAGGIEQMSRQMVPAN